ncbi:cytochrome c biogenesis protein CcdA [Candidatus Woesearchaeota archaeon]|nr:cytochrome c biogenesis protein CcdA [Candidatus Woesearchaeota archaeon]
MKENHPLHSKKTVLLFFLLSVLLLAVGVSAASALPIGLQKIIDYNQQATADFALKISFLIAFVAGMLGILSPCILPFLPAYFSYTFKEKKNLTLMTLVFFAGFSLVFVSLGLAAGFLGEQTLVVLQKGWLVTIGGILLLFLGALTLLGKGFGSWFTFSQKFSNDLPGTFLFGLSFALGWTACLGPILAGILGIGAILGNMWQAALLLFFYSLGNFVPLFLLSFFYDRFNLSEKSWMKGRMLSFTLWGKQREIHSTNLISGLLLLIVGFIVIFFEGTGVINNWDVLGTKPYFYSLQRALLGWEYANVVGTIVLFLFLLLLGYVIFKKSKQPYNTQ